MAVARPQEPPPRLRRRRPDLLAREIETGHSATRVLQLERATIAVGIGYLMRTARQRPPLLLPRVADESHDATGLAVEPAPETDHFVLFRVRLGETNGGFDRFRPPTVELGPT
jgi:hypothetical protein